jgi:hypothetical protein
MGIAGTLLYYDPSAKGIADALLYYGPSAKGIAGTLLYYGPSAKGVAGTLLYYGPSANLHCTTIPNLKNVEYFCASCIWIKKLFSAALYRYTHSWLLSTASIFCFS